MDNNKIGQIIYEIRKQKQMTQQQLADMLAVSNKTVSKWERGLGAPDISLLADLSNLLGVNMERLLEGELVVNEKESGNMKKTTFYVCEDCGNIITCTGTCDIACCGKKMTTLAPQLFAEGEHFIRVENSDGEIYVHIDHPMRKDHYISFIAYLTGDKLHLYKLYPEGGTDVRFPQCGPGKVYAYCNRHGLFECLYMSRGRRTI